jgi:hypothetical protein
MTLLLRLKVADCQRILSESIKLWQNWHVTCLNSANSHNKIATILKLMKTIIKLGTYSSRQYSFWEHLRKFILHKTLYGNGTIRKCFSRPFQRMVASLGWQLLHLCGILCPFRAVAENGKMGLFTPPRTKKLATAFMWNLVSIQGRGSFLVLRRSRGAKQTHLAILRPKSTLGHLPPPPHTASYRHAFLDGHYHHCQALPQKIWMPKISEREQIYPFPFTNAKRQKSLFHNFNKFGIAAEHTLIKKSH